MVFAKIFLFKNHIKVNLMFLIMKNEIKLQTYITTCEIYQNFEICVLCRNLMKFDQA